MNKENLQQAMEKSRELLKSDMACKDARQAAEQWLANPEDAAETEEYVKELQEDIEPMEDVIAFAKSSKAIELIGQQEAASLLAHCRKQLEAGVKNCDCPACTLAAEIVALLTA